MVLVRRLIMTCLRCNVNFTARHVPDRDNTLPDKLPVVRLTTSVRWLHVSIANQRECSSTCPQLPYGHCRTTHADVSGILI